MKLLVAASPGEARIAAVDPSGDLVDVAIWRPGAPDGVGDVWRGRVAARAPAMAGVFVDLGDDVTGFLPDSAGGRGLRGGEAVSVRITRAAQSGKGPRLERTDEVCGPGPPERLRAGPSPLARLAALHPGAAVSVDDPALASILRAELGARVGLVPRAFDDDVEAAFDALGAREAALPGGARMSVHPTPALVAIDVDLGAAAAGRGGKTSTHLTANRALIPALARQIRLRNLGGAIMVDVAGLGARRRSALAPDFAAALADDPSRPRFLGFSSLGLAEIVRPRTSPPLHEILSGPHATGLAALRRLAREVAARPSRTPRLTAAPAVAAALFADEAARSDLARLAGRPLMLRSDPALAPLGWHLEE